MKYAAGYRAVAAIASISIASPSAACWTKAEADAAKVANLNMMMMVTALRCRKGPDDFLHDYNSFVKNNNHVIGVQNGEVRAHFVRINGSSGADAAMDKFVIGIANSYGSGHASLDCKALKQIAATLATPGQSAASLLRIANDVVIDTRLAGGHCAVTVAAK